jgi:DNA-binding XRE family transcriptional regulator
VAEKVVENQDIIEIGNNIQKIRKKNGISQSVLAEKIDVAGNSIYRMEGATTVIEYSCAVTPQVRQTGNRLSGLAGTAYASLFT